MARVILVVQDQAALRTLVRGILQERGYKVYAAAQNSEALDILEALDREVDLVVTDRGPGGQELIAGLQELGASTPVIFLPATTLQSEQLLTEVESLLD